MADKRKLQAEIDRCIKKVQEGVEQFDSIWSKVHEAASANQKEKFEADLKKEIKKLQRLRDQIKGWQNSNEVKDKTQLCEYRKLIEQKMEQFKIVERETKTKAYSKIGLGTEQKVDPKEKEKEETIGWLQETIGRLGQKIDLFEGEQEQISAVITRKKKAEKDKQERLEVLKKMLDRHQYHVQKLELILRILNNNGIEASELKSLREEVTYFIENCEDPSYRENEFMYEDLDLPAAEQLAQQLGNFLPNHQADNAEASEAESGSGGSSKPSTRPSSCQSSIISKDSLRDVTERKVRYTSESREVSKLMMNKLQALSKSAPSTPIKMTNNEVFDGKVRCSNAAPIHVLPMAYSMAARRKPESPELLMTSVSRNDGRSSSTSNEEICRTLSNSSVSPAPAYSLPILSDVQCTSSEVLMQASSEDSAAVILNGPNCDTADFISASSTVSPRQEQSMEGSPPSDVLGEETTSCFSDPPTVAGSVSTTGEDSSTVNSGESAYRLPSSEYTEPVRIDPTLGCSPLGKIPVTPEMMYQLQLIDVACENLPRPDDAPMPRRGLPRMPCQTPPYYPRTPPDNLDTFESFMRFSPEVLFFVFYFFQGTKAQYFAAKALKRQSWRFHTKFAMWFQRYEEPKTITDEFERGTYVYFDFEKWQQRKKENFTFEYRYLEDRDLG